MNPIPVINKVSVKEMQQRFPNYKEFLWYKEQEKELLEKYNGRYLVIKGKKVVGDYRTRAEAANFAYNSFKPGSFIIHHCIPAHLQRVPKLANHQLVTLPRPN